MYSWNLVVVRCQRRDFVKSLALACAGAFLRSDQSISAAPDPVMPKNIKLGFDNFAVRSMEWKAPALIDYASSLKLDSLFISDLDALESFDEAYLRGLRSKAADQGLQIHLGTWSICPTSGTFKAKWGTADELLELGIRSAKALGSPVIRVILGDHRDRLTPGGIQARIADTVKFAKLIAAKRLMPG